MYCIKAYVRSERGLHARPSAEVVKTLKSYKAEVYITNPQNGVKSNARAVLELMMLLALHKDELIIEACGIDEKSAATAVAKIVNEFYIAEEEH